MLKWSYNSIILYELEYITTYCAVSYSIVSCGLLCVRSKCLHNAAPFQKRVGKLLRRRGKEAKIYGRQSAGLFFLLLYPHQAPFLIPPRENRKIPSPPFCPRFLLVGGLPFASCCTFATGKSFLRRELSGLFVLVVLYYNTNHTSNILVFLLRY